MSDSFTHDVFLSYSSKDTAAVHELAERLKRDGLRVWLDAWEIKPGDPIMKRVDDGLEASRVLVLAMSQHAFASDWATLESGTFRFRDPLNKDRRFIPLRLDDAEIKDALKQFAYVDWRNQSRAEYERLLTACRPVVTETKPTGDSKQDIQPARVLEGHTAQVYRVALSADGRRAVSGGEDATVRVWDVEQRQLVATLKGHTKGVRGVALSADGRRAVSGGEDATVRVWDVEQRQLVATLEGHTQGVRGVALSADGRRAVSGGADQTVRVWDVEQRQLVATLKGHTEKVWSVALSADGRRAISGGYDKTVRVWDMEARKSIATLEGHTGTVYGVALSADGRRAISCSDDKTVRVWDIEAGRLVAMLEGPNSRVYGVALSADGRRAVSGSGFNTVQIWELPPITSASTAVTESTRYTNAKVLLVGESGVGKTGLAYRLTENVFKDSVSTDAAWATQLKLPHDSAPSGMEREIWLWDFAGQADYRLIHQLYMDETALAVLVFNPQSENPFEGLGSWDRDLQPSNFKSSAASRATSKPARSSELVAMNCATPLCATSRGIRFPGRLRRASSSCSKNKSSNSRMRVSFYCASSNSRSNSKCGCRVSVSRLRNCAPSSGCSPGRASSGSWSLGISSSCSRSASTPTPPPSSARSARTSKRSAASTKKMCSLGSWIIRI